VSIKLPIGSFILCLMDEGARSLSRQRREVPSSAHKLLKAAEKQLFAFPAAYNQQYLFFFVE